MTATRHVNMDYEKFKSVSYTHLDVYKRQAYTSVCVRTCYVYIRMLVYQLYAYTCFIKHYFANVNKMLKLEVLHVLMSDRLQFYIFLITCLYHSERHGF